MLFFFLGLLITIKNTANAIEKAIKLFRQFCEKIKSKYYDEKVFNSLLNFIFSKFWLQVRTQNGLQLTNN